MRSPAQLTRGAVSNKREHNRLQTPRIEHQKMSGSQQRRRNSHEEGEGQGEDENETQNATQTPPRQTENGQQRAAAPRQPAPHGENDYMEILRSIGMRTGGFNADSGDYVSDENLQSIITQLMISNPGPKGNPPAAPYHVQQLDEVPIEKSNKAKIGNCSICNDEFEIGSEALRLPCKHHFHHECIHQWLNLHNTCPLCREELPTLDFEYENRKYEKRMAEEEEAGRRERFDSMYI